MKKTLALILVLAVALCIFAACGKSGNEKQSGNTITDVGEFKTIGDIANNAYAEYKQSATYEGKFVYVFELDNTFYRAICAVDSETSDAIFNLDISKSDYEDKHAELTNPLEIETMENLSNEIIPQEELDKLVGKTGEELFNDGWTDGSGYNLEDMEFWLNKGAFEYTVVFDGKVENYDEFDTEEGVKAFTVKSVKFNGLGDATNIEIAPLFTKGVWSASIDGKVDTYFVFESETSGHTATADGKGGVSFNCEQNGYEVIFHFGSDDDTTPATFSTADNIGTFEYGDKTVVYTFEYMADADADTFEVKAN